MANIFRVINYDGDIEISIYKKANAVFKTNEYSETEDVCVHNETINIFDLLKENQKSKDQQKEFIKYLEDEIKHKSLNATCMFEYNDTVLPLKEILQKYKSIIGVSDENNIK